MSVASAKPMPRVVVLMGGPDAEREVSLMSGAEIAKALTATGRYEVVPHTIMRIDAEGILGLRPDVIFPIVHGPWGEGGPLQTVLEQIERSAGVGFVGPRARGASLAMNKVATKAIASELGVRTPRARQLVRGEPLELAPPLVIKPADDGSSVDLRICRSSDEVAAARAELEPRRTNLMAEEYIAGREMTVGIVNGAVLPIIEIVPKTAFYDYEAKYLRDDTGYRLDPELAPAVAEEMRQATRRVFDALGLRDVARADFMVDARGAWFLEINTAPGMTTHSLVPMASRHAGVDMPELCARLVEAAAERGAAARLGPAVETVMTQESATAAPRVKAR